MILDELESELLETPTIEPFERLDKGRFDINHPPEKPVPVISLCGYGISTPGNLTILSAQPKAAKTTAIMAAIASMMTPRGDCLGFTGAWTGGAWVHVDTEQSRYDADKVVRVALRRAGLDAPPNWLRAYSTAHLDIDERREALFAELDRAYGEHGKVSGFSIDGVADLCHDPNDSAEAFALVSRLNRTAAQYDCPVIVSLHENPGSENGKTRGHLGSELARKAETNLQLVKDADGVVTAYTERSRSVHISKSMGPRFAWDDAAGMHLSVESVRTEKVSAKTLETGNTVAQVFSAKSVLTYGELREAVMQVRGITKRYAEKYIATLQPGFVRQTSGGLYERSK